MQNSNPEIFFFGQIVGASAIIEGDGIFIEGIFKAGEKWDLKNENKIVTYNKKIPDKIDSQMVFCQTQTCYVNDQNFACFCHPFELHYQTSDLFGWPRMICKVFKLDETDTIDLYSYGTITLPSSPGFHEIKFNTWSLHGNLQRELESFFLDSKPMMNSDDPIDSKTKMRQNLITKPGPEVTIYVEVIMKGFNGATIREMMKNNNNEKAKDDIQEEKEEVNEA